MSRGETIGCGWNIRKNQVYFTVNGKVVAPRKGEAAAFDGVTGRFYPTGTRPKHWAACAARALTQPQCGSRT